MHEPATPFDKLGDSLEGKAYDVVSAMTEDQVRYALWAALVVGGGDECCNFPSCVADSEGGSASSAEAILVLGEALWPDVDDVSSLVLERMRAVLRLKASGYGRG